jgi:hypothetical protein
MHWTVSVGTLLHLLFYAHIIIINFVLCVSDEQQQHQIDVDGGDDMLNKLNDYKHFDSSKYYASENDSYNNDKRLIIEDFYRQSALSVKNIKDISFHINTTANTVVVSSGDSLDTMTSLSSPAVASTEGNKH